VQRTLGFNPIRSEEGRFRCFWSLDSGWGQIDIGPGRVDVRVLYGDLELQTLRLPFLSGDDVLSVTVDERPVAFSFDEGALTLKRVAEIKEDGILRVNSVPR
jgi:non-lysosomal glucosylceramidase